LWCRPTTSLRLFYRFPAGALPPYDQLAYTVI
jgi:hypothetical protein